MNIEFKTTITETPEGHLIRSEVEIGGEEYKKEHMLQFQCDEMKPLWFGQVMEAFYRSVLKKVRETEES